MNTLTYYTGFETDILESFGNLMNSYKFSLIRQHKGIYELINSYCIIRIGYDRGEVPCYLRPRHLPVESGLPIFVIARYFNPDSIAKYPYSYNPREQLFQNA